jgi:IclR family transcriptional regulator, KDG regulon repressor
VPRRSRDEARTQYVTASVTKALAVLDTVAGAPEGLALSEVARRQALPAPSVFRILVTLAERGYVHKDASTGRYHLTLKMWEISSAAVRRLDICAAARPLMAALADEINESVVLGIPHGPDRVIVVEQSTSRRREGLNTPTGEPWPLYCSSAGKALLVFAPAGVVREQLQQPFPRYTPTTICDPARLVDELRQVQRLGYAENRGEFRASVYGAAVALRMRPGEVVACLGAAMPPSRFTPERIRLHIAPALQRTAEAILDGVKHRASARGNAVGAPGARAGRARG